MSFVAPRRVASSPLNPQGSLITTFLNCMNSASSYQLLQIPHSPPVSNQSKLQVYVHHLWALAQELLFFFKTFWCGPPPHFLSLLNLLQCLFSFFFWLRGIWNLSSPNRYRTLTPCIWRWSVAGQSLGFLCHWSGILKIWKYSLEEIEKRL